MVEDRKYPGKIPCVGGAVQSGLALFQLSAMCARLQCLGAPRERFVASGVCSRLPSKNQSATENMRRGRKC